MDRPPNGNGNPAGPPPTWIPSGPPPRKERRAVWPVVAVVCVAIIVAGVVLTIVLVNNHRSDVAAEERRKEAAAKASSESAASAASVASVEARESEEAAALAAAQEAHDSCVQQVGPFRDALSKVDARLNVGVSQGELSNLVGKASIAYNQIDIDELGDGNCLFAAAKMESAFNAYRSTVSRWSDCIYDYYCDLDAIDPGMQVKWGRAGHLIERADDLIDQMDPASPTYVEGAAGDLVA